MVRLLLFLTLVLSIPLASRGQVTVSVDPPTFVLTGNPTQTDVSYHVQVTNTSAGSASIFWSKRMSNNPVPWTSWICDKNLCYLPEVNSCPPLKPNLLGPGESFELQIHMNPLQVEGSADYQVTLLDDLGNSLYVINGQFLISNSTAVKETNETKLSVFPNPATDFFKVSDIPGLNSIELFNIVGNKVRSFEAGPQKQYYVGDLTDGIYLVRLESAGGKVIKTIRLSKR
ncbi:MAG: T9SS type A sorting domain-containing protein [Saprospiraceae bacterium]|uniref:T9SS type A sorting domain-containing protein n=1 Tax=Candidatus Opimibacter skivensis TaxID=2982028 RepID=A0A9D7XR83_9BACT|nr:T9SS type A sorting domain-containing protein [Candidatus Opimibacter skivensis]